MASPPIFHLSTAAIWANARRDGVLTDPSLQAEGFIHCSYGHQLVGTAAKHFAGRTDLVVLKIDPDRLSATVVVEDSYGSGTSFPHVYGPVEASAVTRSIDFPIGPDGAFSLPPDLD